MEKINSSSKYLQNCLAVGILAVMFVLLLGSVWNDSAIMDELAHIPAGFGYLTQQDYRLNPEHPPLLKTLAALSGQIFARPQFPTDTPYWKDDVNGQWSQGAAFLYESGNNPDKIIFWSRLPFLLLALVLGWLLFSWTRKRFGFSAALLTLLLFAFSPTVLTHSRYVTTDLGAAFGFFIGMVGFINFLEVPGKKNLLIAGLLFGLAQLLKFSLILLIPLYVLMLLFWVISQPNLHLHERVRVLFRMAGKTILVGLIGLGVIWIVYAFHVWNYPQARQLRDAEFQLGSFPVKSAANLDFALIRHPLTRPLGQYVLGVLMVSQRAAGGNTAYFLGTVSASGSRWYFPVLYLLKEPLALHALTLIALWYSARKLWRSGRRNLRARLLAWIHSHFVETSALLFIALYWAISIRSPLNIGIRHVLPTFPFIYLLVSIKISEWLYAHEISNPQNWLDWLKTIYQLYIKALPKYFLVTLLFFWLIIDTLIVFPHFMGYYNRLAGGPKNGYLIAVDSNYDWGQDLKRLRDYVAEQNIDKIAIDYFGGGSPRYYLGDKFEPWNSSKGPWHGWLAVSATFRQGAFGIPAPGFNRRPEEGYDWLKPYKPVARAGNSIFIYKLP